MYKNFKIVAFTHKNLNLTELGKLVLPTEKVNSKLVSLKEKFNFSELQYLATCNRVEYFFVSNTPLTLEFKKEFLREIDPKLSDEEIDKYNSNIEEFEGTEAVKHTLKMVSSLESLVVGEKEIAAQYKESYKLSKVAGVTGDFLRILYKHAVSTSKSVFTNTKIAENPVSVVSLAFRELKEYGIEKDSRFILIGAGQTNRLMSKYLLKHGYCHFSVFNRSLKNAEELANFLNGNAYQLDELKSYREQFDVIISSTSSPLPILTDKVFSSLNNGSLKKKILLDLSIPNDVSLGVAQNKNVNYINIETLQNVAKENLQKRKKEMIDATEIVMSSLEEFEKTTKKRQVDLAMQEVPSLIKEIRSNAMDNVFADKLQHLDEDTKSLLDDILNYVEKKYISIPMKRAKEIMVEN